SGSDRQEAGKRKRRAPTERLRRISKYHLVPPRFDHNALKRMIDSMEARDLATDERFPPRIPGIHVDEKRASLGIDLDVDFLIAADFDLRRPGRALSASRIGGRTGLGRTLEPFDWGLRI